MSKQEKSIALGNGFACDVDVGWWEDAGQYRACVHIGEEYYESDPYKSIDLALCEVKGWLEGVKVKLDAQLKSLEAL